MNSENLGLCLVVLLGCGSWVAVNGMFSESPVIWPLAPECLRLASIMTVAIQLANIGPAVYLLVGRVCCKGKEVQVQTWTIYVIYFIGIVSCSLLAGFWDRTSHVFGKEHSTALISLLFFLALVDCTSTVTFLPFMAQFPVHYLSALYIGEGLSGLLPSITALVQTVGINTNSSGQQSPYQSCSLNVTSTRFSVTVYFSILTCLIGASAIGFFLLNVLPNVKRLKTTNSDIETQGLLQEQSAHHPQVVTDTQPTTPRTFWSWKLGLLLILEMWLNCLSNGVTPAVSSYAYTPYGATPSVIIVNSGMLAGTITAFLSLKLSWKDTVGRPALVTIVVVVVINTTLSGYILWLASPMCHRDRPLQGTATGVVLMVVVSSVLGASSTYAKVAIAQGAKELMEEKALLGCGIATQIGSFVGAITTFAVVNTGHFNPCNKQ